MYWAIDFGRDGLVDAYHFYNDEVDNFHMNTCGVYRTKEEAQEVARKMLEVIKK